jgi:hypothetical protein
MFSIKVPAVIVVNWDMNVVNLAASHLITGNTGGFFRPAAFGAQP